MAPLLAHLASVPQANLFLQAFFTDKERDMLTERLAIFRLLAEGKTQREVAAALGCSVVTVTRGAKAFRQHQTFVRQALVLTASTS